MALQDSIDQFELLLREFIDPAFQNLILEDDDPSWNLMGTWPANPVGGRRADGAAGYEVRFEIGVQRSARVGGGLFTGNSIVPMGENDHLPMGQAANAKYLDPTKTPLRGFIEIRLFLARILLNVAQNHQQLHADLISKPVTAVAQGAVEDTIARFRSHVLNNIYGSGDGVIATCTNAETVNEGASSAEVELTGGTYARFMNGDLIVAADSSTDPYTGRTGSLHNPGLMRVVNVDADNRTIWLESEPGEGAISITAGDALILADTYDFVTGTLKGITEGYKSLFRTSGVYPGSISTKFASGLEVNNHSELKSFVTDYSTPVDPTMENLTVPLDKIMELGKTPPGVMISQQSLWTLHAQLERESMGMAIVTPGSAFLAGSGGVAGPVLRHQERTFAKVSSARIGDGEVIGMSPETMRRFMPMGDRAIHWVSGTGLLSGFNSIFLPIWDGTQLTELASADANAFAQFGCLDPRRNFRLSNVRNQRDVAAS